VGETHQEIFFVEVNTPMVKKILIVMIHLVANQKVILHVFQVPVLIVDKQIM
jgi:hypothetical protein